jgi:hypothetical protein
MKSRDAVTEWFLANAPEHSGKADALLRFLCDRGFIVVRGGSQHNLTPPTAILTARP